MLHKGKYYAETIRSTRFEGIDVLAIHSFETEEGMERFINEYNMPLLDHPTGAAPDVYYMARSACIYTLYEFYQKGITPYGE